MKHIENNTEFTALSVKKGVDKPKNANSAVSGFLKKKVKPLISADEYVAKIQSGDVTTLARAITLIESHKEEHCQLSQEIIERSLPLSGKSLRLGITGVPGAGKSTFIEALGQELTTKGHKVAVLAIDPSSQKTKGSILGDKTRMEKLASESNAFIRPSPSAGSLGGVARKTREIIVLCEAAGFDVVIIETVGVGQSEIAVHSMVDFFLLVLIAGAGDELQGIKRGIMEMTDAIAINKADGDNILPAERAKRQTENALHLFPLKESGLPSNVFTCSSITHDGVDDIWKDILAYKEKTSKNGYFSLKRQKQNKYWMYETINERLKRDFFDNPHIKDRLIALEQQVVDNAKSPFKVAQEIMKVYQETL